MLIRDVQAHVLAIPPAPSEPPATWAWGSLNQVLVVIHTDAGLTGYGEAFGYGVPHATAAVINHVLRPILLDRDPTQIAALHRQMSRQTHVFGRYGITTFAISGVDIALWDLVGKLAGQPLYRLLGGAETPRLPAYASLVRYADPDEVGDACRLALQEGYEAVKLHQLDLASVQVAREVVGDGVPLMLDVNCAWNPEEALAMAQLFAPYELYWLEEPLWPPEDYKGLARLGFQTGLALATGENACTAYAFREILEADAATFVQPSVTKVGGMTEWRKVAALAEAYNVTLVPHSPYFGPGLLATAHLIAATPQATWLEYLYLPLEASLFASPLLPVDGHFPLPQGPGLGLEVVPEVIQAYALEA